jgi:hypothetical protein
MLFGVVKVSPDTRLTGPRRVRSIAHMVRAIRLRRVWAILIGMSVVAVTVVGVTIMIHDRIQ